MPHLDCPSPEALLDFHLGALPYPGLDAVAEHLETCPHCQARAQTLDDRSDAVLTALRHPGPAADPRKSPVPFVGSAATAHPAPAFPTELLDLPQGPKELGRLGRYGVLRLIGRGGMAFVFEAEDTRLCRRVALKVIRPDLATDAEARQRFLREARSMAGIRPNAHLVTIYEVDEEGRVPYLAMELLEGESLDRWLAHSGPVPVADVLRLGREAALGLAAVHEHGLIHRDVKPGNLWLEAGTGHVKVLDFGLARATANDLRLTSSDVVAGTPAYLSPEQATGEPLDSRSDLFSLGCVLYELCAGTPPFHGKNLFALATALTTTDPTPVQRLRPDLPSALANLVMELLAKNPARRPTSARAVADRLQTTAVDSSDSRPRRRVWAVVGVLLAAAAVLLGAQVLRVQTSKGTVEIRSEDPSVKVIVEQNGELVTILDPESKQQVVLRAGEYQVKLGSDNAAVKLETDHFTLRRGDKAIVTVRRVELPPKVVAAMRSDDWVRYVAGLQAEDQVKAVTARLRQLNPEFKTEVVPEIEGGVVRAVRFRTDHVQDIAPVRALGGLRVLQCSGADEKARRFTDLSPLRGLKLTQLSCDSTGVADLTPLQGMPLTYLDCHNSQVTDLTPLSGAPLTFLNCARTPVSDLTPLKGKRLTELYCDFTRVTDLTPIKGMLLTRLNCAKLPVTDLALLTGMPLTWLSIARTPVSDLTPLKGMQLTELYCDFTRVTDLTPLRGMPLTKLNCGVCRQVSDLTPLQDMRLTLMGCGETNVSDLTPLKGMPLTTLWCNDTKVSDLTPLKGMHLTTLLCGSTKVTSLAALEGMPLKELGCDLRPGRDTEIVLGLVTLETINGQPAAEWRAGKR